MAVSVHEARAYITNLRTHLHHNISSGKKRDVLHELANLEHYLGTLPMDEDDMTKILKEIAIIRKHVEEDDKKRSYGAFLKLNTTLIQELNIPPLID